MVVGTRTNCQFFSNQNIFWFFFKNLIILEGLSPFFQSFLKSADLGKMLFCFGLLSDGVMVLKAANDYGTGFVFGYLADGAPNAPFDIDRPNEKRKSEGFTIQRVNRFVGKKTTASSSLLVKSPFDNSKKQTDPDNNERKEIKKAETSEIRYQIKKEENDKKF